MGFKKVYKTLQEIFPEIDSRVLRAVAIEHNNDADAAVEAVLVEIIPFFTERSIQSSPSIGTSSVDMSSKEAVATARTKDAPIVSSTGSAEGQNGSASYDRNCRDPQSFHNGNNENNEPPFYDTHSEHQEECGDGRIAVLISQQKCEENSVKGVDASSHVEPLTVIDDRKTNYHHDEVSGDPEREAEISVEKSSQSSIETVFDQNFCHMETLKDVSAYAGQNVHGCLKDLENFGRPLSSDCQVSILEENHQAKSCADGDLLEVRNPMDQPASVIEENCQGKSCADGELSVEKNSVDRPASLTFQDLTPSASESIVQFVVVSDMQDTNLEKIEVSESTGAASKVEATSEMVDFEDEYTLNTVVSRSGQMCSIDLVEDVIADARNYKKTLFSVMESVINLMKEVELKEKAAEQAKGDAAKGGFHVLNRVEDFKQMLQRAKEANDMHAGEVYGEKAILATELRELQSRVLSLSDEKDKSLLILDEMRQTLDMRLAIAENERRQAELEKLEKEKSALEFLAEQELMMEKVVQESNILKQEAEENAKLQEFLVDRGLVVDALQGEIAVICQDVRLLKEKFDERVPFSKSLSSSQTSCILASSSSSLRSMVPDQVEQEQRPSHADSSENLNRDLPADFDEHLSGDEAARDDRKALIDEGWEFFDNREIYI